MQNPEDEKKDDVYSRYNAFRPVNNPEKKHPCKDCFNCLWCSDARCKICLSGKNLIKIKNDENENPDKPQET
ncbi:MAG: hypothetical protein AB1403_24445 [Candidatus Riflebacteria bacterium]